MRKVKFGVVGLGHQGRVYADLLIDGKIKNGLLSGICSSNPANEYLCANKYKGVLFYNKFSDMLQSKDVDAVIICTPHYFHPELGIEAINNDVHVLIEKPAGVYAKQVRELNELSIVKPDIAFGIFYNQRMNPLYQNIKEIVGRGEIGEIRRVNWIITNWWRPEIYYKQSKWKGTWKGEGGGVLLNQAPHQLDLLQWICGMPRKVYSKVRYGFKRDINVEDEVTAVFEYENGATGVFITCTHDIMGTDRLEIHGDLGKIIVEESNKAVIKRLYKSEDEYSKTISVEDMNKIIDDYKIDKVYEEEIIDSTHDKKGYHCELIENFADHILKGSPLIAPGIEGINQVTLANAIYLSSWLKEEVVLPIDEDLYLQELNKRIEEEG